MCDLVTVCAIQAVYISIQISLYLMKIASPSGILSNLRWPCQLGKYLVMHDVVYGTKASYQQTCTLSETRVQLNLKTNVPYAFFI